MNSRSTYKIKIKGLVQGVGFRPFIYHLSTEHDYKGWVKNQNDGVIITLQGTNEEIQHFIAQVKSRAPAASSISSIEYMKAPAQSFTDFKIIESKNDSDEITQISPDIAVCPNCLTDIKSQPHRINYPFINCTNCGPRFSIIKALPYDRHNTTMDAFTMCTACYNEYTDINDRRFHAQPVACNRCGPHYELIYNSKHITGIQEILNISKQLISEGKIIAIKGIGGFHLMCDATNENAVTRLRQLKARGGKPFAVMFHSMTEINRYAKISEEEKQALQSWRRPIVLLREKRKLAYSINPGINKIGAFLPYMPFHYLLFDQITTPALIMTSGNYSDTPVIADNQQAFRDFKEIADAILVYNREIYNKTDDSVIRVINNHPQLIRRARGYVPDPVSIRYNAEGILATGAELKNCFCIGKGYQAIMSQHIGDLKNYETYRFYSDTIDTFRNLFKITPSLLVSDMHPDYLSTKYAEEYTETANYQNSNILTSQIPHIRVQHHHAHIASVMAEHKLDETVTGICMDGTGFGDDRNIWGGEFLISDLNTYSRYAHFAYMPMPGGDKAVEEPWRMAISFLYHAYGDDIFTVLPDFLSRKNQEDGNLMISLIKKQINTPYTSSAGRLFDAVAALLQLCTTAQYDAEGPMRLESIIDPSIHAYYDVRINREINFAPAIQQIMKDIKSSVSKSVISTKFHNTIINVIENIAMQIYHNRGITKVVLSGGTFQNAYLLENTISRLERNGLTVFTNHKVPCNDGGIALGQLAIATKRRYLCV